MKIKQLAEKIKNEMPKDLDEIETLRYIYIYIGKNKRFDPEYYYGNRKTREKIYRLSRSKMHDEEFLTEKRELICLTIANELKLVAKEFGIDVEVVKDDDDSKHLYNIARLKNKVTIGLDLQNDLAAIHTNQSTNKFAQGFFGYHTLTDTELGLIDEKIGYKKVNENYKEEQIYKLMLKTSNMGKFDKFKCMFEDSNFNETVKNTDGYVEAVGYVLKVIEALKLKSFAKIVTCYRDNDIYNQPLDNRQYSMLAYIKEKSNFAMYMFKKKDGKFVPISPVRLQNLTAQGMKIKEDQYSKELKYHISKIQATDELGQR